MVQHALVATISDAQYSFVSFWSGFFMMKDGWRWSERKGRQEVGREGAESESVVSGWGGTLLSEPGMRLANAPPHPRGEVQRESNSLVKGLDIP